MKTVGFGPVVLSAFLLLAGISAGESADSSALPPAPRNVEGAETNLSAYDVEPLQAPAEYEVGESGALTPPQLKALLNRSYEKIQWSGRGLVGSLLKSASQMLGGVDDATLDVVQEAFEDADSAKIRPESGGVGLDVHIPLGADPQP